MTGHEGLRGMWMQGSTYSQPRHQDEVGWLVLRLAAFALGEIPRYSFYRRLSGPQGQSEHEGVKRNLHHSGTRDRTRAVQARSQEPCHLSHLAHLVIDSWNQNFTQTDRHTHTHTHRGPFCNSCFFFSRKCRNKTKNESVEYAYGICPSRIGRNLLFLSSQKQQGCLGRAGWPRFNSGCLRGGVFCSLLRVQTGPGVHSTCYKMSNGGFPQW